MSCLLFQFVISVCIFSALWSYCRKAINNCSNKKWLQCNKCILKQSVISLWIKINKNHPLINPQDTATFLRDCGWVWIADKSFCFGWILTGSWHYKYVLLPSFSMIVLQLVVLNLSNLFFCTPIAWHAINASNAIDAVIKKLLQCSRLLIRLI